MIDSVHVGFTVSRNLNVIAATSWPLPLISQLFSPCLTAAPFFTVWIYIFVWIFTSYCTS